MSEKYRQNRRIGRNREAIKQKWFLEKRKRQQKAMKCEQELLKHRGEIKTEKMLLKW